MAFSRLKRLRQIRPGSETVWIAVGSFLLWMLLLAFFPPAKAGFRIGNFPVVLTALEFMAANLAFCIFAIGWNAYRLDGAESLVLLSCGFLLAGVLDFFHALNGPSVSAHFIYGREHGSALFWMSARLSESLGLVGAALLATQSGKSRISRKLVLGVGIACLLALVAVCQFSDVLLAGVLPGDQGIVQMKSLVRVALVTLTLTAAGVFLLVSRGGKTGPFRLNGVLSALFVLSLMEFCLIRYSSSSQLYNLAGHGLKVIAFFILYREVFVSSFRIPYEKLLAAQEELARAIGIRDDFLALASHELKTPLTPIRLHTQSLLRKIREGRLQEIPEARLEEVLRAIDREISRFTRLSEDLLDSSLLKSGSFTLEVETIDLREIVRETAEKMGSKLEASCCALDLDLPAQPLIGLFDPTRIEQLLRNLLENSAKHAPKSRVCALLTRVEGQAVLEVRDHGPGIDSSSIGRIFERFERAAPKQVGGLGLGLYICRKIVEAHCGTIRVESQPGQGTRFLVELPILAG